jgi:hypothetical protein
MLENNNMEWKVVEDDFVDLHSLISIVADHDPNLTVCINLAQF